MRKILIIEDDKNIRSILAYNLSKYGYKVVECEDGLSGLKMAQNDEISLILMDVMLTGIDGINCTKKIRAFSNVPIIMLSALEEETDKINGLNSGANDYITKPFSIKELIARIEAHLRTADSMLATKSDRINMVNLNGVLFNLEHHTLTVNGKVKDLSTTEYNLLSYLSMNPNKIFSRSELLSKVWGYEYGDTRTVDVTINRLRNKIEKNPSDPKTLKTLRGSGYYCCV